MKKSTDDLFEQISNSKDIMKFLEEEAENLPSTTLSDYLQFLIEDKAIKKSEIIKNSQIEKTYFYQLLRGEKSNPSRNKILLISLALNLSITETRRLLKLSNNGDLYPKNKRDSVIIYCILNCKNVIETNLTLDESEFEILE